MNCKNTGKKKFITFSYDDGDTQDIRLIELMNKYGLKGTFNLNSEMLARPEILSIGGQKISHYRMHADDVKTVYEGHEVAVHTLTHARLPMCDDAEVIRQVERDRLNLSELMGYEVVGMAYPCDGINYDNRVADIIRNHTGIKYARTIVIDERFDLQDDLFCFQPTAYHLDFDKMMQLGQNFIELKTETPKIFYIWGHSFEMDLSADYWIRLEEFFKLISGKDDIFYGTNKEVLL